MNMSNYYFKHLMNHFTIPIFKTWRYSALMLLPMLLSMVTSCIIGDVNRKEQDENASEERISMTFTTPILNTSVLVDYKQAAGQSTRYTSTWNDQGKVFMFAKQNGKMINLGQYPISSVNSNNTIFKIEVDASDKLDSKESYQLYCLSGAYNVDDNELFYRVNLVRNSGMNLWFTGQKGSTSKMSNVAGTAEMLFVINKTDKPIQFVHKGYDVEEKWYYTKAEVSVEDGHIQKAEQGSEVVGNAKEINVFDGTVLERVVSYYVPNGKKIQDAQLIAEIDGKEVRSVNRISSDVTLETNHSYGIFAVWDGEKLTLGDGSDEPVIHVSTGSATDDYSVVEVGNDETITIKTTKNKLPKVGDIMASGPTEKAPYGFLCRVDAVEEISTRADGDDGVIAKIKKGLAYLDELLPDYHFPYTIKLDELLTDYAEDSEGNRLRVLNDDDYRWVFPEIPIPIRRWRNKDDDTVKELDYGLTTFDLKLQYMMDPKELTFFFDVTNGFFTKYGVTYNFRHRLKLDADVNISYDLLNFKDYPICTHVLTPIVIEAGIPIVITPKFDLKFTANIGATLEAKVTLADLSATTYATLYYTPLNTKVPFFEFDNEDVSHKFFLLDETDTSLKFKGYLDFTVHPELTFGLYGSNLTEDVLGGGFRIDGKTTLNASFQLGYNKKGGALYSGYDGYEVTDEASMEIGNVGEGQVYMTYMKIFSDGKGELSKTVTKDDDLDWKGKVNLFYSSFKDVEAKLEKTGYITFTGTKRVSLIPFTETDYGFAYTKESAVQERWNFISAINMTINPKYRNDPKILSTQAVICDLPFKDLEPNTTYNARPYVVSNMVTENILILRDPIIRFKTDSKGQVSNSSIEDIPGLILAPKYIKIKK